jgi:hypothetical protein
MILSAISLMRSCAAITAWPRLSSVGSSNAHRRVASRSNTCRFQASQIRSIPCDFCASYWFRNVIGPPQHRGLNLQVRVYLSVHGAKDRDLEARPDHCVAVAAHQHHRISTEDLGQRSALGVGID